MFVCVYMCTQTFIHTAIHSKVFIGPELCGCPWKYDCEQDIKIFLLLQSLHPNQERMTPKKS